MGNFAQDLRYGFRGVGKNPGFTSVLVLVLALGIAGVTAMFTVVDQVLIHPLPYPHSERIMTLRGAGAPPDAAGDWLAWYSQNQSLESLALYGSGAVNLAGDGRTAHVSATVVSSSFFSVFAVSPKMGRGFDSKDEVFGDNRVAICSDRFWRQNFAADPTVVGRTIALNGIPHTIVGVMPGGFSFPGTTDIWIPRISGTVVASFKDFPSPSNMVGRLRPEKTPRQASSELNLLLNRLTETYTARTGIHFGDGVRVRPLQEVLVRNFRTSVVALFAAVCLVLLIVCANATSMLLARSAARQKEMAVRLCLGASRARLMQQLLSECILLALIAGVLGIGLAIAAVQVIRSIGPADIPRLHEISINLPALAFALAVSLVTGIVVGLTPSLQAVTPDLTAALKQGSTGSSAGLRQRIRSLLVVGEVAVAVVLLIGASLVTQSLLRLTSVEPGFDPHHVITLEYALPAVKYGPPPVKNAAKDPGVRDVGKSKLEKQTIPIAEVTPAKEVIRTLSFERQLLDEIKSVPSVKTAGIVAGLPLTGDGGGWEALDLHGKLAAAEAVVCDVGGDYFGAMRIPLITGRSLSEEDTGSAPKVMVINQTLAHQLWNKKNPVGDQIVIEGEPAARTIVGVVGDVKLVGLGEETPPQIYLSYAQPSRGRLPRLDMTLVVRTVSDPSAAIASIRNKVASLDKDVTPFNIKSMDDVISESTASPRFREIVLGCFALVALILAVLGVYGVVAFSVTSRRQEIGIRMALGAQRQKVLWMILAQATRLGVLGIGLGLVIAAGVSKAIASLLFGINPGDPATFTGAALALFGAVLVAAIIPAWQASRVEPVTALRYE